ncbi:MAG: septum formation initiator family protein [Actinomycetota bacterium]|nr:septum formation initiator family protein [Actinomycetota bacterium]
MESKRDIRRKTVSPVVRRRRRVVAVFLVLAAAGLITYLMLGPVTRNIESSNNLDELEAELEEERARTSELESRESNALTDEYVEEEARKMGYVKPGEIPIIVLDDEDETQVETEDTDTPQPVEESSTQEP